MADLYIFTFHFVLRCLTYRHTHTKSPVSAPVSRVVLLRFNFCLVGVFNHCYYCCNYHLIDGGGNSHFSPSQVEVGCRTRWRRQVCRALGWTGRLGRERGRGSWGDPPLQTAPCRGCLLSCSARTPFSISPRFGKETPVISTQRVPIC